MKFWQLISVARNNPEVLHEVASLRKEWGQFLQWLTNEREIVQNQDRAALDFDLPDDFTIECLKRCDLYLFVSADGWLSSIATGRTEQRMQVAEVFRRYGGEFIEDAFEKSVAGPIKSKSVPAKNPPKPPAPP